jgi:hypothetical protein
MKWDSIKGLVGAIAPTIGTAIGGPVGAGAGKVLAQVLGVPAEPAAGQKALSEATPEQLAEVKKADIEYKTRLAELEVDVFALETADKQNARVAHGGDWTPKVLALLAFLFFGGYVVLVTLQPPEQRESEAVINLVLGYLGGVISAVVSYYFGASNKEKE